MENIFEGAKFGTLFNLYNNQLGVLICVTDICAIVISEGGCQYMVNLDGSLIEKPNEKIIVSKYQEPIDEKKLDELAKDSKFNDAYNGINHNPIDVGYIEGFKAGYNDRAKEEQGL